MKLIGLIFGTLLLIKANAAVNTIAQVNFNAVAGRTTFPVVVALESNGLMTIERQIKENPFDRGMKIESETFSVDQDEMERFIEMHRMIQNVEIIEELNDVECDSQEDLQEEFFVGADYGAARSGLTLVHTQEGCWGAVQVRPANDGDLGLVREFKESLIKYAETRI